MLGELGLTFGDIGATALLAIALLMIFTGRLVPKRYYDEALSRCAEHAEQTKNWREAAESLLEQNTKLLQRDDVSVATLHAIRRAAEEGDTS